MNVELRSVWSVSCRCREKIPPCFFLVEGSTAEWLRKIYGRRLGILLGNKINLFGYLGLFNVISYHRN